MSDLTGGCGRSPKLPGFRQFPRPSISVGTRASSRTGCRSGMSAHLHLIYREFRHRQLLGNLTGNVHRSRHALNADTIREMHLAFRRGGRPPRWWMGSSRSRSRTGADDGADEGSRLEPVSGMSADAALLAEIDENLIRTTQGRPRSPQVFRQQARGADNEIAVGMGARDAPPGRETR